MDKEILGGFASGEAKVTLTEEGGETLLTYDVEANVGGKIAQVGSRLIDMTAKKMADIFFGKFTDEVSPAGLSTSNQAVLFLLQNLTKNNICSRGTSMFRPNFISYLLNNS